MSYIVCYRKIIKNLMENMHPELASRKVKFTRKIALVK